jgi:two-component system, NarL family, response regulator DevR
MTAVTGSDPSRVRKATELGVATELIRLLVVDDHAAVRRGLGDLLEDQPDFTVVATVASATEAMSTAEQQPLDVAVVDFQLPDRNGLWVSRKLKRLPDPPRVLLYSAYSDPWLAAAAVPAGADGILSKGTVGLELCEAIRSVARGRGLLPTVPPPVGELMRRRFDHEEQAIFGMALAGIPRPEIARILRIPQSELESRLSEMLSKLETIDPAALKSARNSL